MTILISQIVGKNVTYDGKCRKYEKLIWRFHIFYIIFANENLLEVAFGSC